MLSRVTILKIECSDAEGKEPVVRESANLMAGPVALFQAGCSCVGFETVLVLGSRPFLCGFQAILVWVPVLGFRLFLCWVPGQSQRPFHCLLQEIDLSVDLDYSGEFQLAIDADLV